MLHIFVALKPFWVGWFFWCWGGGQEGEKAKAGWWGGGVGLSCQGANVEGWGRKLFSSLRNFFSEIR